MFGLGSMWIDPVYRDVLRETGLDRADRVIACLDGRTVAWSKTTDTIYVPSLAAQSPGFYVKRYLYPKWRHRVRGMLRGTFFGAHRAQAECAALMRLRAAGVPAVRPVACGSLRVLHFLRAAFLITEEVPGARNLTAFARDVRDGTVLIHPRQRRAIIDQLATDIAHLRSVGAEHGQLFWRNILFRMGAQDEPEFYFVDPDPQPIRRWLRGAAWWRRELARLFASALPFSSRSERLRFFVRIHENLGTHPDWIQEIREIEQIAQRWHKHEQSRIHRGKLFTNWNRLLLKEPPPPFEHDDMPRKPGVPQSPENNRPQTEQAPLVTRTAR